MPQKFEFLVKNSNNRNLIYAIKFDQHQWHYFQEEHSIISQHQSLPVGLEYLIESSKEQRTIELILNEEQVKNYYQNGNFVFKNIKLKTFREITGDSVEIQPNKRKAKLLKDLSFNSGETNPLLFLAEFEKCLDLKTDQDKMQKLRNLVDEEHKPEFSQLQLTSDWPNMKNKFIVKYSLPFIENKKRDVNVDFREESSLRSYVNRKFLSFSKYTTMPLINQMDIILNELPTKVAYLFMVHEKFDCGKEDILDFCDMIEYAIQKFIEDEKTQFIQQTQDTRNEPLNRMGGFTYDPNDTDGSDQTIVENKTHDVASTSSRGRGRGRGKTVSSGKIAKRGRPRKNSSIPDVESEDYDCLDQISTSSKSSWSSRN